MDAKTSKKQPQLTQVTISDIIFLTLHRWPWLILSLAVCCGLAYYNLLRTPSLYTRTAEIFIKSDSQGKTASDLSAFADMGLLEMNNNLYDEIEKIKSPDIMTNVVQRLNLNMSYTVPGRFHNKILYGSSLPLTVSFLSMHENEGASAEIVVDEDGSAQLLKLKSYGRDIVLPDDGRITFGDTIQSSLGPIVVNKTPYFVEGTPYNIFVSKSPLASVVGRFMGELNVSVKNDKGNILVLTATDQSTQRAEDLLNTVIDVYNDNWMRTKNQISVSTSEFINERLGVIERELGSVDHDISSYKSEHQIPDVQQAASMYMSESQQASSQLLDLNNQLQMARYVRNFITNTANRNQALPSAVGSGTVNSQIDQYNALLVQRNQYVANSSENNPLVVGIDSQLASLRTAIIQSIDNEIVALNTSINNIQLSKNRATAQISANPTQARYLLSVERQQKVKESLYLFLLQKREENELSQAFTAYNTEVITYPMGSNAPTSPDSKRIMMLAFLVGLALPFGYTFLTESLNTKVRGRKDVEDLTMPFLGEIPLYVKHGKAKKNSDDDKVIIVKEGKRDIINEAFRVLRTNLEFMKLPVEGANVIAITSFNPGSGKSFITMNLGYTLAIKKKRVLIIDGDLRHGSSSAYIGSPEEGLSDYLAGNVNNLNTIIKEFNGTPHLDILPIGSMAPNPTELLESERFGELIETLKKQYDYIIIDCPPVEVVADAQIIDKYADRTIFIVRAGLFERFMLGELEKLYEDKKYKNMAFILNGTTSSKGRYGYSHGYRYGYGYGYGYGYQYGSDKKAK